MFSYMNEENFFPSLVRSCSRRDKHKYQYLFSARVDYLSLYSHKLEREREAMTNVVSRFFRC